MGSGCNQFAQFSPPVAYRLQTVSVDKGDFYESATKSNLVSVHVSISGGQQMIVMPYQLHPLTEMMLCLRLAYLGKTKKCNLPNPATKEKRSNQSDRKSLTQLEHEIRQDGTLLSQLSSPKP